MTNGGSVDGNASVRTSRAGGGAGTSRTEPKEMEAGGPQRVAAWVDAQGGGRDGARPSRLSWRAPTSPGPFRAWTAP